jgi:hypothetical protein
MKNQTLQEKLGLIAVKMRAENTVQPLKLLLPAAAAAAAADPTVSGGFETAGK